MNINDSTTYFCSCSTKSYGKNCEYIDNSSCSICSSNSLCRSHYYSTNSSLCLCSMNRFGPRCYLERICDMYHNKNPCFNGGLCYVQYDQDSLLKDYICICQNQYYGDSCESSSGQINIKYLISDYSILASVIQLYNYDIFTLDFILKKQQISKEQPLYSTVIYPGEILPNFGFLKIFLHSIEIKYFLLYYQKNEKNLSLTINLNANNSCQYTHFLLFSNISNGIFQGLNRTTIIFQYHSLCQQYDFRCFYDENYFCLCDRNKRAECFRFNRTVDSCRYCLMNSPCIQENPNDQSNFLCLCSKCYF
ncbi:unnamed protein product, partial [Adineta ricciae]